jgi:hypothetical protein
MPPPARSSPLFLLVYAATLMAAALRCAAQGAPGSAWDVASLRAASAPAARAGAEALQLYESKALEAEQRQAALTLAGGWASRAAALVRTPRRSCWSDALSSLKAFDCRALGTDGHRRLALAIASCTHQAAGKPPLTCPPDTAFDACGRKLRADAWTSFELAQRDATAICFYTQLEAMTANWSSSAAESATVLLEGLGAIQDSQQEQLAAQARLQALQEQSLERQSATLEVAEQAAGLAQAQLDVSQAHSALLTGVASTLSDAAALSVEALHMSKQLSLGLGWLLTTKDFLNRFAAALAAVALARALWWLALSRRAARRQFAAMQRTVLDALAADSACREARLMEAMHAALEAHEQRIAAIFESQLETLQARQLLLAAVEAPDAVETPMLTNRGDISASTRTRSRRRVVR